jgi:putative transposase
MINREHLLPLIQQCRTLNLSWSGIYYITILVSDKDRELMELIDKIHLDEPYLNTRGIRNEPWNRGHKVGRSHVRTLTMKTGIEVFYRKPRPLETLTRPWIYSYLLKEVAITGANKAWAADITYITMAKGFCYPVAIMDLAGRKVLSFTIRASASRLWRR